MAHEPPRDSALLSTLSDLMGDFADLFQKEMRLARAEITTNIARKLQAGIWMSAAGLLGLLAALLVIQALVFGLIAWGLAPHWACLVVAAILACLGAFAYFKGRQDAAKGLAPERAINQIKQDIKSTKEQLV
ncbi:phage holin family protein [Arvimicrobium flavum]|uniref:phage holin family protein n=1 Tax=Arvimicrobium flavum TaxID=3393320 RepID=UPI00237A5DE1|nr:phage holin family protein [Mesorhizobium shangrilense]